jgi:lauroyl/myristoyl acyltransferase
VTETRRPVPVSSGVRSRLAERSAATWLRSFFRLVALAPAVAVAVRPVFVFLAFWGSPKIRRATAANARRLLNDPNRGEQRAFGRRVVGSFYDFVCDIGRTLRSTREELESRIESVHGTEHYHAARAAGRGAVIVTAHMGSFEVGLVALPVREKRIHVVFKRDRVGAFEQLRTELRKRLNVTEAAVDDGWGVWVSLRDALLNDEVVAVQGDRVLAGQKGITVSLLGGALLLPSGPFKLAASAGAPVIPIFSSRQCDGRIAIVIEPAIDPADVEAGVRRFAECLARQLVRCPDQWLVLEPAFAEDAGIAARSQ